MIRDQADQLGCARNPDAIRATQDALMDGISKVPGAKPRARRADGRRIPIYVSDDRWVAECPHCHGGIEASTWNPALTCLECGREYEAVVPSDHTTAEALLMERPNPRNRNWFPHAGETVATLAAENAEHLVETEPVALVAPLETPPLSTKDLNALDGKGPVLGSRCPNCNRLGPHDTAVRPCPNCGHAQEAAFIVDEKCPGWEQCKTPVFHHRPSGMHFWCFGEGEWVAPGVRR